MLAHMNNILFGVVAGLMFGAVDVALMIPMKHPDKPTAMLEERSSAASPSVF